MECVQESRTMINPILCKAGEQMRQRKRGRDDKEKVINGKSSLI